jgi:hypothetical protein
LKSSPIHRPKAMVVLLSGAVLVVAIGAQAPQGTPPSASSAPPLAPNHPRAAPTNLKVLPRDLTGDQVHEIMERWESELGTQCSTCHAADPKNLAPNGRPRLNFADDSKPEKVTARMMYKMTDDINMNYVSKIDNSGAPVTCGTCHAGHLGPPPFVAAP